MWSMITFALSFLLEKWGSLEAERWGDLRSYLGLVGWKDLGASVVTGWIPADGTALIPELGSCSESPRNTGLST